MSSTITKDAEKKKFIDGSSQEPSVRVQIANGFQVNKLAKYVEAVYTNSNMTVTYNYYESSSKATLYNSIVTSYSVAQDTEFTSAEWA